MSRGLLAGQVAGVAGQGAGQMDWVAGQGAGRPVQGRIHAAGQLAGCSGLAAR